MSMTKLDTLVEDFGFSSPTELAEAYICDGVVPGICQNDHCDYSTDYEPDQDHGWCESCGTNTVVSAFIMMGII